MSGHHHNANYIRVPKKGEKNSRYNPGATPKIDPDDPMALHIPGVSTPEETGKIDQGKVKKKEVYDEKKMKKWRLIVRNLPFTCTKDEFDKKMVEFGAVYETTFPLKDEKCKGFAFVQFRDFKTAVKVIKDLNMQKFNGRPVAVDYAIPKDTYESAEKGDDKMKVVKKEEVNDEQLTDEEIEENSDTEATDQSDNEDDDSESCEESDSDSESESKPKKKNKNVKPEERKEDEGLKEGRTLFIRNLSFETRNEDLLEYFSKFGKVNYALVAKYKGTDHSRGNGFVQFAQVADAQKCVALSESDADGLFHDKRRIFAVKALPREDARKMEEEKKEKRPKDNRNLHLLRVAVVRQGTAQSKSMSEHDANLRIKIEGANREKIKNLHVFVSSDRLCVHNVPIKMGDRELSSICNMAVEEPCIIKECRVMRDLNRLDAEGKGKSRGFAFVKFTEHKHALECLQKLNNNPDTFSDIKRPVIEFSLENMNALNAQAKRLEKSKLGKVNKLPAKKVANKKMVRTRKERNLAPLSDVEKTKMTLIKGGVKPLPSHIGPKIRHKRKTQDPGFMKKKKKRKIAKNVKVSKQ